MKKNVTMRAAGFLLVGVMLTASIVSGTYAKYVTQDSAQDTARVAKFGVVAAVSGDLFGKSYSAANGNSIQAWSVNAESVSASANTDKVVAPGTKNDTGMTISVTGTPEVSTSLELVDAVDNSGKTYVNTDIELKTGNYGVMVEYTGTVTADNVTSYYKLANGTYTAATSNDLGTNPATKLYQFKDAASAAASYKPVTWKVGNTSCTDVAAVKTALAFSTSTAVPNTNLANAYGSKTITWEWPFSTGNANNVTGNTPNDGLDTILGDMIADSGDNNYAVVKANNGSYLTVKYADVNAAEDSANTVKVAYTGDTAPTVMTADSVCAVLTVSFGARLTVTQVD